MEDDDFGAQLLATEKAVSTSRLGRLVQTGRSALGLATTMLGGRDGTVDVEALRSLTTRLGELKGVGMKVGQILSFIDPSLPPETRALLSVLQRQAPASEASAVRQTIRDAFGARADELLAAMNPQPFAVASIGQVHRAELPVEGAVVVKVRHPGIEDALNVDFSTALGGLGVANTLLFGAASDARGLLDEARAAMLAECDFLQEAAHQRAFSEWLRGDETLVVPEVIDAWSSRAVLTTRWEPGLTLDEFLAGSPSQARRDCAGAALFRASVGAFHQLGLLHADPHPGNFAFREERVVLYDFGCVRRFSKVHTAAFARMAQALRDEQRPELLEAARGFGFRADGGEREALVERFARSFFAPMLTRGVSSIPSDGVFEAKQMMKDKRALMKLGLPPHVLFVLRLRFGLYAVLARLGARADWGAIEADAAALATRKA